MTKAEREKFLLERARNRWYALAMAFSEAPEAQVINVAMKIGFASTDAMRSYFIRWGDKLMERYGKLPYCKLNSNAYERYMESEANG